MQRFHAERLVSNIIVLSGIRQAILKGEPMFYESADYAEILRDQVAKLDAFLGEIGMRFSKRAALNLLATMRGGMPVHIALPFNRNQSESIDRHIRELCDRIREELEDRIFLQIERPEYFEQAEPLFGPNVQTKFPSASPEIEEAGKCLALRRPTACVMHLMRVLELGLNSLAKEFSVPFKNANWQTVIDQVEKAIRTISSATHGPNWKDDQQFFSEAAVHFRVLKDAWRNHSMHIHERYSEDRAETIFQSVRGFMQHLATRLSEPTP